MCKWHMKLNVLVCCLSCVRKRTIYDGLEDHRRVSCTPAELSSLRHIGFEKFRRWKFFMHLIFALVGHRRNIFNDENFPIYSTKYTVYMSLTWTKLWEIRQDHWWLQACQTWQSCWWKASELQSSWQYQYVGLTSSEGARTKAMHSWKERSNNASLHTILL